MEGGLVLEASVRDRVIRWSGDLVIGKPTANRSVFEAPGVARLDCVAQSPSAVVVISFSGLVCFFSC